MVKYDQEAFTKAWDYLAAPTRDGEDDYFILFERSEFLIPTWVTPQYRATSKKKIMFVCSTNLGFSVEKSVRVFD